MVSGTPRVWVTPKKGGKPTLQCSPAAKSQNHVYHSKLGLCAARCADGKGSKDKDGDCPGKKGDAAMRAQMQANAIVNQGRPLSVLQKATIENQIRQVVAPKPVKSPLPMPPRPPKVKPPSIESWFAKGPGLGASGQISMQSGSTRMYNYNYRDLYGIAPNVPFSYQRSGFLYTGN